MFQPVEIPNEPDFGNDHHLNLLAYKAILGEVKKEEKSAARVHNGIRNDADGRSLGQNG